MRHLKKFCMLDFSFYLHKCIKTCCIHWQLLIFCINIAVPGTLSLSYFVEGVCLPIKLSLMFYHKAPKKKRDNFFLYRKAMLYTYIKKNKIWPFQLCSTHILILRPSFSPSFLASSLNFPWTVHHSKLGYCVIYWSLPYY